MWRSGTRDAPDLELRLRCVQCGSGGTDPPTPSSVRPILGANCGRRPPLRFAVLMFSNPPPLLRGPKDLPLRHAHPRSLLREDSRIVDWIGIGSLASVPRGVDSVVDLQAGGRVASLARRRPHARAWGRQVVARARAGRRQRLLHLRGPDVVVDGRPGEWLEHRRAGALTQSTGQGASAARFSLVGSWSFRNMAPANSRDAVRISLNSDSVPALATCTGQLRPTWGRARLNVARVLPRLGRGPMPTFLFLSLGSAAHCVNRTQGWGTFDPPDTPSARLECAHGARARSLRWSCVVAAHRLNLRSDWCTGMRATLPHLPGLRMVLSAWSARAGGRD